MLVCVFLLMCLKLLSDAVRHLGLPSAQPSAHVSGPPPCTSWNNETGVCLERESCKTIEDAVIEAADFASVCNAADQAPTKVCCPHGSRSKLMKATEKDKAGVVDWGKCGVSNKTLNKVVGGHNASLGDWPWMVALYYRSSLSSNLYFHCGGSLISDRWIVTAAHCIRDVNGTLEPSIARLGDLNLDESVNDGAEPVDVYIDEIVRHPNYTQTPAIINDIALLHLQETVKFTKFIRPICLLQGAQFRQDSYYTRKRPYVTGWGRKAFNGSLSAILQETSLPIINNTECAQAYAHRNMARIDETVLCAGRGGKDSCQGDSGGPLMLPNAQLRAFFLAGIVSYGIRCADHFPGVYTRIPAFTDWISEITGITF